MKPRTKLEKEVTWLSSHLLPPSMEQIEEAKKNLFGNRAFYIKKYGYDCLECGHRFQSFGEAIITCPNCGKQLSVERTRKHCDSETEYFMLMQTIWHNGTEFVVQRLFELRKHMKRGEAATYSLWDIAEYFTNEEKQICLGITSCMGRFHYCSELTIRKPSKYIGYYGGSYESYRFGPGHIIIESEAKTLLRNGYNNDFANYLPQRAVELFMCNRQFEQLYKIGGEHLAKYHESNIINQVKIANRHHYKPYDYSIWVDTIGLLRRLKMDDRNTKHICPENLHTWHNELLARWQRIQAKEVERQQRERERERHEAELRRLETEKHIAEEYVKRIARFLQLNIQDELISITPIPTVEAVHEEGKTMHHCVFAMGYYKKPEVLLLSARDKEGKRIETIEVNLNTYQVEQSRGVHNSNTKHHNRILSLMAKEMNQIKQLNQKPFKAA